MPLYIITQIEEMLPPWAKMHFRSPRAWKTVLRCWVATWASFVIILPTKSALELGNAGFFGFIIAVIVPPSMPIQMFIFWLGTICVGMGMGWGIGAAAMKAANAVRNATLENEILRANQTSPHSADPDSVFNSEVFRGDFLEWRSSLVYGGFMAFSALLFSYIRAYSHKLAFLSVFGIIAADVFCTIGPLIPINQYTIFNTFFISTGCYVGIALICILFIFPETMSHVHLNMSCGLIALMKNYIEAQDVILAAPPDQTAGDVSKRSGTVAANTGLREKILMTFQGLKMRNALVEAELFWGRWSGTDCKNLEDPLELLISRLGGFQAFPRLVANYASSIPSSRSAIWQSMLSSTSQIFSEQPPVPPIPAMPQQEGIHEMGLIAQFSSPRQSRELTLAATLPRLRMITMPLREACSNTLGACAKVITDVNTRRWSRSPSSSDLEKMLDVAIESLRLERASFVNDGRLSLADPFVATIPSLSISSLTKALHATPPLRAYIVASTFSAQLVVVTDAILLLAEFVRSTCAKRRKSRLWAPRGLRALGNWFIRKNKDGENDDFEDSLGATQHPGAKESDESESEKPYKRDPDSRPPSNIFQKIVDCIYKGYKWSKSKEAIYMYKYTFVTIALWLPSVFRSTAHLYYVQKGVWGLIAAQTILNVYASDHLYNLVARCVGTAVGMVLGVMIWYIGSGNGSGNPYGLAASLGVFLVPVIYARVFAPPLNSMPYLMCNATIALVVGFSWMDSAIFTEDNPGVGWPVGWKRAVVVFIGAGASFVMMAIPPVSGRKAVRLHNASVISELGNLYQLLMATWIKEEETQFTRIKGRFASTSTLFLTLTQTHTYDEEKAAKSSSSYPPIRSQTHYVPQWFAQFRKRVIPLANQLRGLHVETEAAQWEGSIRGAWPFKEYQKLLSLEGEILAALTQLASALSHLDPTWRASLIRGTLVLNPDFITEVLSVFTVISQALRTGEPLHQIMPSSLLDRLLYHHAQSVPRLPEYERKPRHKRSRPFISEVNRAGYPDNRSRGQAHPQLRPKPKASMMSIVSTAYTDVEQSNGVQEEVLGKVTSYEDRLQDINFMYFASAVSAVRQTASCLDELHEVTKELCGEIPFEGFREWRGEHERSFAGGGA